MPPPSSKIDTHPPGANSRPLAAGVRRPRQSRGAILVMVLGMILVLSALITAFLEIESKEIILRGQYVGRDRLRLTAYAAFETTIGVLNTYLQLDGGLYGPAQGWGDPLDPKFIDPKSDVPFFTPPNGVTVKVTITDLTGLMPLNRMSDIELTAMFDSWGIDPTQVEQYLDTFDDWKSTSDVETRPEGAESQYYESQDPAYDPPHSGNITSFDEFHYIKNWNDLFWDKDTGAETDYYDQFRQAVTLRDSGGPTNLNTAPLAVLNILADPSLGEIDPVALPAYISGADGKLGTDDDLLIRNSNEMSAAGGNLTAGNSTAGTGTTAGAGAGAGGGAVTAQAAGGGAAGGGGGGGAAGGGAAGRGAGGAGGAGAAGGGAAGTAGGAAGAAAGKGAAGTGTGAGAGAGNTTATGNTSTPAPTTTMIGTDYRARLLKINVDVSVGDAHFLLSTIVKPNTVGTGIPASFSSGGSSGAAASTSSNSTTTGDTTDSSGNFTGLVSNVSGAYPFKIIAIGENYDLP